MSEHVIKKYVRWENEDDSGPKPSARVKHWHETYNAAMIGLSTFKSMQARLGDKTEETRASELARAYADEMHGPIDMVEVTEHFDPDNPYQTWGRSTQPLRWIYDYKVPEDPNDPGEQ